MVQQQPTGLDDDDGGGDDERLETAESSDDERAGYPTFPADGVGSRPSVNSLRRVSLRVALSLPGRFPKPFCSDIRCVSGYRCSRSKHKRM